jgi:hypothetical protein
MRKNGLGRLEANAVARGIRAWVGRWYRPGPVVPTTAFRDRAVSGPLAGVPEGVVPPGHQRAARPSAADASRALARVLLRHDTARAGRRDDPTSETTDLTVTQHRDILARARAALRDALDADQRR